MQQKNNTIWIVIIVALILAVCCCVAAVAIGAGLFIFNASSNVEIDLPQVTLIPPFQPGGDMDETPVAFPTPVPQQDDVDVSAAQQTMDTLQAAEIPPNDAREAAMRLKGIPNIPETVETPPGYDVGDRETFYVSNVDTNETREATLVLRYETDHAYIWVEEGISTDSSDVAALALEFENKIYPTNRNFFGSEWTPGIDNDPHVYIFFARDLGDSIAGYFSSSDSVHPLAHPYSNGRESFFLNADNLGMDEEAYSVLAHEFQHMIHWYRDSNETSWMNEGFSMLAELLNGYETGYFDYLYASQPDQSLNDWPNDSSATTPYYGSSFLYLAYFLDRFGDDATKALVAEQENNLESVDLVLENLGARDAQTNQPINADDVFADWVVTNYLHDTSVGDGRYHYGNYSNAPRTSDTEEINNCAGDWQNRSVNQYGVDYIRVSCNSPVTLNLEGTQEVKLVPEDPYSGQYAFWSNKGDDSDITLTRSFDLTQVSGPVELQYRVWYDIEEDYDYLYLTASVDGATWKIVDTPNCTLENPSGNSFGCGYSGVSAGWIEQKVDLSDFAGQQLQLRFEYITDGAVNGEGLLLDDVSIPAINYSTDFESDDGGWEAAGFVRVQNRLPQTYRVSIIREGSQTTVETFTLAPGQPLSVQLDFGGQLDDAIVVVSGTARYTRQDAVYRFSFQP